MFSLIMGFWKMLFKKSEYQVLIVGIDYAGKTVCGHAVPNADVRAHASPVGVLAHAVLSECARADQEHIQRPRAPPARQDSSHRRPQYWARAHRALKSSLLGPGWRAELTLAVGEVRDAHYGSAHYRCTHGRPVAVVRPVRPLCCPCALGTICDAESLTPFLVCGEHSDTTARRTRSCTSSTRRTSRVSRSRGQLRPSLLSPQPHRN